MHGDFTLIRLRYRDCGWNSGETKKAAADGEKARDQPVTWLGLSGLKISSLGLGLDESEEEEEGKKEKEWEREGLREWEHNWEENVTSTHQTSLPSQMEPSSCRKL